MPIGAASARADGVVLARRSVRTVLEWFLERVLWEGRLLTADCESRSARYREHALDGCCRDTVEGLMVHSAECEHDSPQERMGKATSHTGSVGPAVCGSTPGM